MTRTDDKRDILAASWKIGETDIFNQLCEYSLKDFQKHAKSLLFKDNGLKQDPEPDIQDLVSETIRILMASHNPFNDYQHFVNTGKNIMKSQVFQDFIKHKRAQKRLGALSTDSLDAMPGLYQPSTSDLDKPHHLPGQAGACIKDPGKKLVQWLKQCRKMPNHQPPPWEQEPWSQVMRLILASRDLKKAVKSLLCEQLGSVSPQPWEHAGLFWCLNQLLQEGDKELWACTRVSLHRDRALRDQITQLILDEILKKAAIVGSDPDPIVRSQRRSLARQVFRDLLEDNVLDLKIREDFESTCVALGLCVSIHMALALGDQDRYRPLVEELIQSARGDGDRLESLLILDGALDRLYSHNAGSCEIFEAHFLEGFTLEELATRHHLKLSKVRKSLEDARNFLAGL